MTCRCAHTHSYSLKHIGGIWIASCSCCPWESSAATFDRAMNAARTHAHETQGVVG